MSVLDELGEDAANNYIPSKSGVVEAFKCVLKRGGLFLLATGECFLRCRQMGGDLVAVSYEP